MFTLNVVIVLALVATMITLGWGLKSMSVGGKYDEEHSEQLMFARVGIQAFAVAMMLVALFMTSA